MRTAKITMDPEPKTGFLPNRLLDQSIQNTSAKVILSSEKKAAKL